MKNKESNTTTGDIMASIRRSKGIRQDKFAAKLKITATYLSLVENNKKKPAPKLYRRIAKELKIPFEKYALLLVRDTFPNDEKFDQLFIEVQPLIKQLLDVLVPE